MGNIFLGQMDYIFFIYGLAFVLLSPICFFIPKSSKSSIPWNYLGFFALIHGINEWLDMLALSLGDNDLFMWTRVIVLAVSFICLVEFGRLTCERLKYISIGWWIHLLLIFVVFLQISEGSLDLEVVVRYSLGLTGGLWAALAMWRINKEDGRYGLMALAAASMTVFALAAGLVVPKAEILLATVINNGSFLKMAGFPVELLRGFAACGITAMLWYSCHERKFTFKPLVIIIFILLIGWVLIQQAGQRETINQRERLVRDTRQAVEILDLKMVEKLTGLPDDVERPEYLILKNELQQMRDSMNSVRYIYLMRKMEGKIICLVDSDPLGRRGLFAAGQADDQASPKLREVFDSGKMTAEGQYTDSWGTWFTVFTALKDERTGKLAAVFGMDQNVHILNLAVAHQRLMGIIFVGILCLGVLLLIVYWQRFSTAEQHFRNAEKKDLLDHWGMAIIVGLFGLTLTVFVFLKLHSDAWDLFQTTFQQRAMSRVQNVSQEIQRQLDRLDGLCRFMGSSVSLDRGSFDQYVAPFLKDVPVHAFVWAPRIKSGQLLFYESFAMQDGIEKYQVYEKDVQGKNIPVLPRDEYFPVYYVQPFKGNDKAAGFDMASEPIRRAAMQKSCDTGLAVVTPPLLLMQGLPDRFGFIVFMPVYIKDLPSFTVDQRRKSLKGFVVGVFVSQEFLKGVYSRMPPEGLACLIEDPTVPKASQVLYRHRIRDGMIDWTHPVLKYKTTLGIADRQWQVMIIPSTTFIERNLSTVYWWALLIGMLLTGLMAALLNVLVTARYRADNLVKLRTSELNKEKELLRKREEEFHLILDSTAEAIYGIDLNGNCSFCNPSCLRMIGYDRVQDLLGKNMHALLHHSYPDGRPFPVDKCRLYLAFKNNLKVHIEEIFWRKDGTSFPVEVWSYPELRDGQVVGAVISFLDITERKNAEEVLRKREAYLTSILDNFPHLVWLKDTDGRFLAVNNVFAKACGRSVNEIIGRNDFDVWPKELAEKYQVDDNQVMQSRAKSVVEELILNEGIVSYFETYKSPIFDSNGIVMGTLGFSQDITERKRSEDALKRAKDMAEKALAIKDEFTSTVSHELRTPLAAIKSSVDILDTEVPGELTKDQKLFVKRVKSNVDRLARLINDVLDLSKLESGKMVMNLVPLRPEGLVGEVVETQIPLVKSKGLTIATECGENLPALVADKDRLIQVLNNLINNALKFTQEGGIVVGVHVEDKEFLKFSVRDTGVGIKEEDLPKLFQKFQQVGGFSQQVAGTGLGLAICKNIVEKHHGLIWVESEFGRGSSFNFVIPIRKEKRILIVDDDEGCLGVLRKTLEIEDLYEIETASDGFWAEQKY